MIRAIPQIVLVVASLMLSTTVRAHDIVEQVVEMLVQPRGGRLVVRLHVPATVLVNAKLPQLDDGRLDTAALDAPLRIVTGDIARNLDIWQTDAALAPPRAVGKVGADGRSVDVDLTYVIQSGTAEISARLNTFQAIDQPVRTNVHFQASSEREYLVSVTGAPVRVLFNPGVLETLQQFSARGLRAVLDGGDQLLFLVCLLIPVRRARTAASLFAAMMAGQAVTILIAVLWPAKIAALLPALAMVGASTVVIAALQNIVRARLRWIMPLAIAFGAFSGFTFGNTIAASQQFAGSHREMALVTFLVVVMAGQLWLGALMWGTRAWLHGLRLTERTATVVASVLIAHSALDRVVDRGHVVAQAGSFAAERVLVWLTLGWACVILLVLVVEALRHRWMNNDPDHLTNVVQA
jgi:hypothetical protein